MKNILVMDYISYEGAPAPQLRILKATDDDEDRKPSIIDELADKRKKAAAIG